MKALLYSLAFVSSIVTASSSQAMLKPNDLNPANKIVMSVVEKPRVLVGTTNAQNLLGSTTFSLPIRHENARAELRASLLPNQGASSIADTVSSNPKAFHMDVRYVTDGKSLMAAPVRLTYRSMHTTPDAVATRILTYSTPVSSVLGEGQLVATVQQRANPDVRDWKTTATFIRFMPK